MSRSLPERPNLAHLAKQAKRLLKEHREGDAEAARRLTAANPRLQQALANDQTADIALADAQFAIAREYGFQDWAALKRHIELLQTDDEGDPLQIVNPHVMRLGEFFSPTAVPASPVGLESFLETHAQALVEAHQNRSPAFAMIVQLSQLPGQRPSDEDVFERPFSLDDAKREIATAFHFESWRQVQDAKRTVEPRFEQAVEAIVHGRLTELSQLLQDYPKLVGERSAFGHRATLLHYVSANGVENHRQKSPQNSGQVARQLLNAGAEPDARSDSYGGGDAQTALCLTVSSGHPHDAGVQGEIVTALLDGGANVDGVAEDGLPLATALAFGYLDTARLLASRGARISNVVLAAGLGRLDLVEAMVDGSGSLCGEQCYCDPFAGRIADPAPILRKAFFQACILGHAAIARRLAIGLESVDFAPQRGQTALHWAAYHGHLDVVRFLVEAGARTDRADEQWHSLPIDWAKEGQQHDVIGFLRQVMKQ